MDYAALVDLHRQSKADVTIAAQPVTLDTAHDMGIFRFERDGRIAAFEEKPSPARLEEIGGSLAGRRDRRLHRRRRTSRSWRRWGCTSSRARRCVEALAEANVVGLRPRDHPERPSAAVQVRAVSRSTATGPTSGRCARSSTPTSCLTQPGAEFSFYHPTRPDLLQAAPPAAVLVVRRLAAAPSSPMAPRSAMPRSRTRSSACACRSRRARR